MSELAFLRIAMSTGRFYRGIEKIVICNAKVLVRVCVVGVP